MQDDMDNYLEGAYIDGLTLIENQLIDSKGKKLHLLATGAIKPSSEPEIHFVEVWQDKLQPETDEEKVWIKYISLKITDDINKNVSQATYDVSKYISRKQPDLVFDSVIKILRKQEERSIDSNVRVILQKTIIKIRNIQNKDKSQTRFNITNYGGLHDFGL